MNMNNQVYTGWEAARRRSSMSMSSRRNSLLSVSMFDFMLGRSEHEYDADPFAPLSIHEGISFTAEPPMMIPPVPQLPSGKFVLTDRSESSVPSVCNSSYSSLHSPETPVIGQPVQYYVQPVSLSCRAPMPVTPDQPVKYMPSMTSGQSLARPPFAASLDDDDDDDDDDESDPNRFKRFHEEKWSVRYKELIEFHKENGHAAVPHTYNRNPQLARWVKRQRRQYKLKKDGKPSTMTTERLDLLNSTNFIWDSHDVNWREKLDSLVQFLRENGHCNVPSNYSDKKLATWVKCQRRQYKLYWDGKPSAMGTDRIMELEKLGFEWEIRSQRLSDYSVTPLMPVGVGGL